MEKIKENINKEFTNFCKKTFDNLRMKIYSRVKDEYITDEVLQNTYLIASKKKQVLLSHPRSEGLPYEQGGGFRVSWGGDRSLLYHPAGRNHHGGVAYWKLSAGEFKKLYKSGRRRFDLDGNETIV